jgi:predicted RNA-binding Zn ribbon-like protein
VQPVFELIAGDPSLDFANTLSGDRFHAPKEKLNDYADLLAFARQAALVDGGCARGLADRAARDPAEAGRVLARSIELREAIFRIFWALGTRKKPAPADLALLNRELASALSHREIVVRGGSYSFGWKECEDLDQPVWAIAVAAADLLADGDRGPIRMCSLSHDNECTWIFLDETKNRSRRWCSMKDCGNRAKARRHYERAKGA